MMIAIAAAALLVFAPFVDETARHVVGERGQRIADAAADSAKMGFSGAVLAARDGEVVAAVGVGEADEGRANTPATLFELASVTKQFTAAAILKLEEEGKLKLEDPIGKHLPGVPEDCAAITIEHLLRHTSGIPGSNAQGGGDDLSAVLPGFLRGGPRYEPGSRWEYWNQGYSLLSEIVARASGMSYTEYCRTALFAPAGMEATCFTGDEAPEGASVAVGRSARGPSRSALEHPYGAYGFQYRGMGGAVSNVWDVWRWDRALRAAETGGETGEGAVLSRGSVEKMFRIGQGGYGLGWFVRRDAENGKVYSHGGGVRGFVCEVRRYPEHDALLVVLANSDNAPLRQVVGALEAVLFEDLGGAGLAEGLAADLQRALIGRYRDDRGRVVVLEAIGPVLHARILWGGAEDRGPVTRAKVTVGEDGAVMLDDGSGTLHEIMVERTEAGEVRSISVLETRYERE